MNLIQPKNFSERLGHFIIGHFCEFVVKDGHLNWFISADTSKSVIWSHTIETHKNASTTFTQMLTYERIKRLLYSVSLTFFMSKNPIFLDSKNKLHRFSKGKKFKLTS